MTITLDLHSSAEHPQTRRAISDLSLAVAKSKKIVVVTGAGISCSCGIPDFRSSDGLYALVKQKYPDIVLKGRDLFDASLFRDQRSTAVFYTFISRLKRSIDRVAPSRTHRFLKTLDSKKKLLRSYTQNIDGLEEKAGLLSSSSHEAKSSGKGKAKIKTKDVRNVQLHGDIHQVRCVSCSAEYACAEEHLDVFDNGTPPECPECATRCKSSHLTMSFASVVHGLKKLVKDFAKAVHSIEPSTSATGAKKMAGKVIFVNKTAPGSEWADIIDYHVAGETDDWCERVEADWRKSRPQDWEVQQTLDGDINKSGGFKVAKELTTVKKVKGTAKSSLVNRTHANQLPDLLDCKKKPQVKENIAPSASTDMVLSTPDVVASKTNASPLSPSKRRGGASHYGDGESSPSKRRVSDKAQHTLPSEERGLLFGDHTNVDAADTLDLSMEFVGTEDGTSR
ncbi:NAD-dependent histone deacetylase HST [Salix suchowensis]|nr:NAD-dependent histone deacetylase HST [Salix suchowensis]